MLPWTYDENEDGEELEDGRWRPRPAEVEMGPAATVIALQHALHIVAQQQQQLQDQ
jgi:hypothetical protein